MKRATIFKKAFCLAIAMVGRSLVSNLTAQDLEIPSYSELNRSQLRELVKDLEADLEEILQHAVHLPKTGKPLVRIAVWLASHYDQWNPDVPYSLGTVRDFQQRVGRLREQPHLEMPPYGEVLVQGFYGLAVRHPEYMLVRDLGLLYGLYCDCESIVREVQHSSENLRIGERAGENRQSLARAVIVTCFNLLEAFVSGLARTRLMSREPLSGNERAKLEDTRGALRSRLVRTVRIVSQGRCLLEIDKAPLSVIFGEIKNRRDAFVHCEPGPQKSHRGYSKEVAFHDVPRDVVAAAFEGTLEIIRSVWLALHGVAGPKWLPPIKDGRLGKPNLRLHVEPWRTDRSDEGVQAHRSGQKRP